MRTAFISFRCVFSAGAVAVLTGCTGFSVQKFAGTTRQFSIASVKGATSTPACDQLFALAPQGGDVYKQLQNCIDSVPEGGTLALAPGIYNMHTTVHVRKGITVTTAGNPKCELAEQHACAELRARADSQTEFVVGFLGVSGNGATIRNIVVNGNRANRMQSAYADLCRAGTNIAQNMQVEGSNITIEGVVVKNALCAAGLGIMRGSSNITVSKNIIANNGTHDQQALWADGMTVIEASNSRFTDNLFVDNTDVDAVFGGCPNCVIQRNKFVHSESFAGSSFAALQIHAWPGASGTNSGTSGDYSGSDISANVIDCGLRRRCGFGLILGGEPWYTSPLRGGFFHDNSISNALNGLLIEKASGLIRIKDNLVYGSGGQTLTNSGMRTAVAYNIPDATNVQIEDTMIPRSAYASESFSRAIANWWERDVSWSGATAVNLSSASLVQEVFRQVMNREVDSAGLAYWGAYVDGGHSRQELINEISKTPEAMVRRLYRELLRREADTAGLNYFLTKIQNGASESQVRAEIMASSEYAR